MLENEMNLSFEQLIFAVIAFLVVAALHGFALAAAAGAMGDSSPRHEGRMTLNPFTQLDLLGLAAAVLTGAGWIRPVPLLPQHLRLGLLGVVICVIASLLVTVACTSARLLLRFEAITLLPDTPAATAVALLNMIGRMGIWFGLVNVLPVPPLTGGQVLLAVLPGLRDVMERYGIPVSIIMLLIFVGGIPQFLHRWAYRPLALLVFQQ
jgi:Zn-dependent protease